MLPTYVYVDLQHSDYNIVPLLSGFTMICIYFKPFYHHVHVENGSCGP